VSKSCVPRREPGQGRHGPIGRSRCHCGHDVHRGLCRFALHCCGQRNLPDGISGEDWRAARSNRCKRSAAGKTPGRIWTRPALVISGSKLLPLTDCKIDVCRRNRNRSGNRIDRVGHVHFYERNIACGICSSYCDQINARLKRDVTGKAAPAECHGCSIAG